MFEKLIKSIAPSQIDPQMLLTTEFCLLFLLSIFLIFGLWIIGRILARYLEIVRNRHYAKKILKENNDLRSARDKLRGKFFQKTNWAREPYQAFHLAWEEARPLGEEKAILPIRLREFLPPEIVLDGARNRRIAEALPGIFVALGIFGTFLGLVLGLRELEFGKLENLQNGVGHLISGLSLAFLTSLGGIALSIIFSFVYRLSISRLECSFLALDSLLCRIYPYEPQERYARRLYDMQADIKQGLQTLATDVATQMSGTIGNKFGEALENHLVPVMKDLHGWIEDHIENNKNQQDNLIGGFNDHLTRLSKVITEHFHDSQNRQTEAMESVLQHYSVALTETFQNQFQSMEQIISDTTDAQRDIKQQLVGFNEQMQRQFQSQSQLIEKTNRTSEILGQSLDSLESIAQKLKSTVEDISTAASVLESSAISAKEGQDILRETMAQHIDSMGRTREELETTWQAVTQNAGNLVEQIRQTIHELTTVVGENLVQALDSFDGKVAEVVERFSGTLFETNQTISEVPSLMVNMNENITAIGNAIAEQKDIVSGIKDASETVIAENFKIATDATKHLGDCTNQMATAADRLQQFLSNFNGDMSAIVKAYSDNNRENLGELTSIVNELIVEMRQSQSVLDQNGILENVLKRLECNSIQYPGNSDQGQQMEVLTDPLKELSLRIQELKDTVSLQSGNGNGKLDAELFKTVSGIDQQVGTLPKWLKAIVTRLDNLNVAAAKVSGEIESVQAQRAHEEGPADSRWWPFGRGAKK